MNNKGFTLIELVAIIALLGMVFLLTYTEVDKSLNKNTNQLYEAQLSNIKAAAKNWAVDNLDKLPEKNKESCYVTLETLQNSGYIEADIKNPNKKIKNFPNVYVTITKNNENYVYKVIDNGTSSNPC